MLTLPLPFILNWIFGLISVALVGASGYVLWGWHAGKAIATAWLVSAVIGAIWSLGGRFLILALFPKGDNEPRRIRRGKKATLVMRDGTQIYTESEGPVDAPLLIMTHGWGLDATAWYYQRQYLSSRFRLLFWDMPGLGRSSCPPQRDYAVERLAIYLREIIASVKGEPAILVGHSIGGMTMLTLCRRFPDVMGAQVKGLVLMDTTYTQPLRTTIASGLFRLLQKPVIEPLLYLTVWLSPFVWFWNLLGYLNGTSHIANRITSFSRGVTRGQLDFASWFAIKQNPAVIARGLLALLKWDESATLHQISLPTQVLVGDADRITRPFASEHIAQTIPQATLVRITPSGHAGLLQEGGKYSEAIAQWCGALASTRAHGEKAAPYAVPADGDEAGPYDTGMPKASDGQRPTLH
jgi:pimeloyl-ACP methyl ester carboxylesterase